MKLVHLSLVAIGLILMISSSFGNGLLFNLGVYVYPVGFIGIIITVIGLWRIDKERKEMD